MSSIFFTLRYFMDVKCPGCYKITTVFSHAQTVVVCAGCSTVLCQPTGGKARFGKRMHESFVRVHTYSVYRSMYSWFPIEYLETLYFHRYILQANGRMLVQEKGPLTFEKKQRTSHRVEMDARGALGEGDKSSLECLNLIRFVNENLYSHETSQLWF